MKDAHHFDSRYSDDRGQHYRLPFAVLPIVLTDIAEGLQVAVSSWSLDQSPLIMFITSALIFNAQHKRWRKTVCSCFTVINSRLNTIRVFNLLTLYKTIILGAAIAVLNVLLPADSVISHIVSVFGNSISSMGLSITVWSALAVPMFDELLAGSRYWISALIQRDSLRGFGCPMSVQPSTAEARATGKQGKELF